MNHTFPARFDDYTAEDWQAWHALQRSKTIKANRELVEKLERMPVQSTRTTGSNRPGFTKQPTALLGQMGENLVTFWLESKGYTILERSDGYAPGQDLKVRDLLGNTLRVEVKTEAKDTGRTAVEVQQNGQPSGIITSRADLWVFVDTVNGKVGTVPRRNLLEFLKNTTIEPESPRGRGYDLFFAVPHTEFKRIPDAVLHDIQHEPLVWYGEDYAPHVWVLFVGDKPVAVASDNDQELKRFRVSLAADRPEDDPPGIQGRAVAFAREQLLRPHPNTLRLAAPPSPALIVGASSPFDSFSRVLGAYDLLKQDG